MPDSQVFLAIDLGASGGRVVAGLFDGAKLSLEEVYRFDNGGVPANGHMFWPLLTQWQHVLRGLRAAGKLYPGQVASVGVDTWGVDFALLGRDGQTLANPRHYRDPHTETIMDEAFRRVPRLDIFRQTGIQFMRFNTLFQLLALQRDRSPLLDVAETMLFMPDLFHYWFTGIKVNEYTDASTSQMLDPARRTWATGLIRAFALPERILGSLVQPGTMLGPLRTSVAQATGLAAVPVIAPATHDTAAAVAAVPAQDPSWAYISSGTWSLMGVEIPAPLVNDKALSFNFTNEGGIGGTIRLLKNIMGLWLVQECRRIWERASKTYSYEDLMRLAEAAPPFASIIDPDDASFILPPSMPAAIADFCKRTGQPSPTEPGPVIRCALESLALRYRWVLERLEDLTGRRIATIHIVGGGSQNTLLCQLTADACNRPVIAGPVEATAIGNVLVQALGLGLIGSLGEARAIVRDSFDVKTYTPHEPDAWQGPYQRFLTLLPNERTP
jgi:rhamnulokinase